MKRSYLLLYLLTFSFPVFSQHGVNIFKESNDFWNKVELKISDEEKKEYLADFETQDLTSFHFFYLNEDTLPDLIHQNADKVEVYLHDNNTYIKVVEEKGNIIGINQNNLFNITTYHFMKLDCCDNGDSYYQQWISMPGDSGLNVNKLQKIYFSEGVVIPDFLNINLKFNVNKKSTLFNSPTKSSQLVGDYLNRTKGYALSSQIDSDKKIWWFVIMDPVENILAGSNGKRMGWMLSENLQVVDR